MITQPIELVLFDAGGTLLFEKSAMAVLYPRADAALWKVLREAGVTLQPMDLYGRAGTLLEAYYGFHRSDANLKEPTIKAVLDALLRERGFRLDENTLRSGLRAMFSVTQANWAAEEDSIPTLRHLKALGYRLGLISNVSDEENLQALIDKGGQWPYLEHIISSAGFGLRKPDPGIFRAALAQFGTHPRRAVMVGDSYEADVRGAHAAGVQAIWITRRIERPLPDTREEPPEAIIEALSELPELLSKG